MPLLALSLLGCISGDGVSATETRTASDFTAISVTSEVDAEISIAPDFSVEVTCDSNLLEHIETEVSGGVLTISTPNNTGISPQTDCYARITAPSLASLRTSGSGDLFADGDLAGLEELKVSGSGDLSALGISSSTLTVTDSGSGDLTVEGDVGTAAIKVSGSGGLSGRRLTVGDAEVKLTGSGDVTLTVTGDLDARLSGSGDLTVYGDPASVSRDVSGSGDVLLK